MDEPMYLAALQALPQFEIGQVRRLTSDEADRFLAAVRHLNGFEQSWQLIEVVQRNDDELRQAFSSVERRGPADQSARAWSREVGMDANRRLVNYLTACTLFQSGWEKRLKSLYGRSGPEVQALDAFAEAERDSFAYRVVHWLRNCSQHVGLPVTRVLLHSQVERESADGGARHAVSLVVDSEDLIRLSGTRKKDKKRWSDLWAELRTHPRQLDVARLVTESSRIFETIDRTLREVERPRLLESADVIAEIGADAIRAGGTPAIGPLWRFDGDRNYTAKLAQPRPAVMKWLGCDWFKVSIW